MRVSYKAVTDRNRCVACGVCAKVCPKQAIHIVKGSYSQIDVDVCVGCGLCVKACPAGIISKVKADEIS